MTETERTYAVIEADEQDQANANDLPANRFMKAFESHPDVKRLPSGVYLLHRVYIKLAVHSAQGRRTDLVSGETKSRGENSPEDVVENNEKSEGGV